MGENRIMVYTLTVAPCIDYRLNLDGKPLVIGDVNRPVSWEKRIGGKGISVGSMLTNLKVDNIPMVAVGGPIGEEIKKIVEDTYGPNKAIYLETEAESRMNIIILADTDTRLDPKAPKIKDSELNRIYDYLEKNLKKDDILVLSGSLGQEKETLYADLMDHISSIGCTTIVDSVGNALKATFKNHPLFIKPNDQELGDLIGHKVTTDEEIIAGGLELLDQGPQNVVVSMGGRGSFFFAQDKSVYFISAAKGYKFINPVGTGDSSIAGFIKGIVEKQDIVTCMKWMAAAGGATAFSHGFGSLELFNELVPQIKVEKIK